MVNYDAFLEDFRTISVVYAMWSNWWGDPRIVTPETHPELHKAVREALAHCRTKDLT